MKKGFCINVHTQPGEMLFLGLSTKLSRRQVHFRILSPDPRRGPGVQSLKHSMSSQSPLGQRLMAIFSHCPSPWFLRRRVPSSSPCTAFECTAIDHQSRTINCASPQLCFHGSRTLSQTLVICHNAKKPQETRVCTQEDGQTSATSRAGMSIQHLHPSYLISSCSQRQGLQKKRVAAYRNIRVVLSHASIIQLS